MPSSFNAEDVARVGPCVDWQWAVGKIGPRCRRNMSCGAHVPDSCPLSRQHLMEQSRHAD